MQGTLEAFLTTGILAFILTFMRIGTAVMIMPGLGDSFVPERIRLHMALGISFVLFPFTMPFIPVPVPESFALVLMIVSEFLVGLLMGTVARIFMTALDTAGMVVSMQSGLSNAQVFNPSLAAQGSLIGAFLSMSGVLLLLITNLHHLLIAGMLESYNFFPLGKIPDTGSMAEIISKAVAASFNLGVKLSAPFIVVTLLLYVGMGVLARLMPQVQVFLLALPVQIMLALVTMIFVLSTLLHYWVNQFQGDMVAFLHMAGG
ncbi:MAG: flagellar type III secretion system protein FliR [Alphaproteobacteria bacterium]|nr:flagellar type III secretion system protein FliR [Alphaproteobacteria bacterium]